MLATKSRVDIEFKAQANAYRESKYCCCFLDVFITKIQTPLAEIKRVYLKIYYKLPLLHPT